jgi:hypothetical protein
MSSHCQETLISVIGFFQRLVCLWLFPCVRAFLRHIRSYPCIWRVQRQGRSVYCVPGPQAGTGSVEEQLRGTIT